MNPGVIEYRMSSGRDGGLGRYLGSASAGLTSPPLTAQDGHAVPVPPGNYWKWSAWTGLVWPLAAGTKHSR